MPALDQALELHRFDLGSVLFALEALLRLLIVVELPFDPLDGAVEHVDARPEQFVEVEIEAGIGHGGDERVEDVGDGAFDDTIFGGRSRIGFAFGGTPAVELQLGKDVVGWGCAVVRFELVMLAHGMLHR